jgi:hypothetical protein
MSFKCCACAYDGIYRVRKWGVGLGIVWGMLIFFLRNVGIWEEMGQGVGDRIQNCCHYLLPLFPFLLPLLKLIMAAVKMLRMLTMWTPVGKTKYTM